jgi:hypothetical protein
MSGSTHRLVMVLGMHRSGTSALARVLPVFGIGLGERLMPAVAGDNEKGFWEDLDIYGMNIDVMSALGADWHSTQPLPAAYFDQDAIHALRSRAYDLLADKLKRSATYGLKDPRLSRLLPFWKPIFCQLGLQTHYLIATRNPISVARSLQRRNSMPPEQCYLLWRQYTFGALSETAGDSRLCVDYDELMLDPPRQLRRLGRFFGEPADHGAAREYCSGFLEDRLRRSRHFIGDLEAEIGADSKVCELYTLLRRVALDDRPQTWDSIDRFVETMGTSN